MYNLIIIKGLSGPVIRLYIGGTRTVTVTVTINNYLTGFGTVTGKIYLTGSGYGYRTGSCTYPVLKPRFQSDWSGVLVHVVLAKFCTVRTVVPYSSRE
jgi:hypothetical protein